MRTVVVLVGGLALGGTVGACGATLGTVQKASDIAFTAAEAACLGAHANLGPRGAREACPGIEEDRAQGAELITVNVQCPAASAAVRLDPVDGATAASDVARAGDR
jgi:hypothetical protein